MFKVCISKELILMDEFSVLKMQKKKKITTVIQQSKDLNKKKTEKNKYA